MAKLRQATRDVRFWAHPLGVLTAELGRFELLARATTNKRLRRLAIILAGQPKGSERPRAAVCASGRLTAGTEAGDCHVQVGAGSGKVQALADEGGFHGFAAAVEAVE